jgi:hypothetical protein
MPAKQADPIYRLKITLREVKPPIWRRVEVPGGISLASLHEILNEAMGWFDGHLHEFTIDGVEYTTPDTDFATETRAEDDGRWRLDTVVTQVGAKFRYDYDFGDGWEHDVVVEAIEAPAAGVTYPRVTAGRRACPPEDCGGPWGYAELLEALADPSHEDHEARSAWVAEDFDPEAFSIAETNAVLAERFAGVKPLPRRAVKAPTKRPSPADRMAFRAAPETVKVAADGTIRLPRSVLASMGLTGGGTAVLLAVGNGVMLMRDPRRGI